MKTKQNIKQTIFNKKGKVGKTTIILGIIAVVFIAAFGIISANAFSGGTQTKTTQGTNQATSYQSATLKFVNYEYIIEPNTLKKDIPVKLTVDTTTVVGCMRDVVISEFGVRKYVTPTDNVIEFTPTKEGTFWIVCSMNMGRGTFKVSSSGASSSDTLAAPTPSLGDKIIETINTPTTSLPVGTCGMATGATGGCGCGRR
ncbi:MAG: hypothetical protein WC758_06025 [Candidatus Woesearchaeota archaeon]|jgi:plastocyanin domain-containing protein